jgi:hypothetical protein
MKKINYFDPVLMSVRTSTAWPTPRASAAPLLVFFFSFLLCYRA